MSLAALANSEILPDGFDRHVIACVLARAVSNSTRPVCHSLGLAPEAVGRLVALFPGMPLPDRLGADAGPDTIEEPDLRRLLLDHASDGYADEPLTQALAAIVARTCQGANHLWEDLGLCNRGELSAMLKRHFARLADANTGNMRWKKFFYRQLCELEGIRICKSPNCEICTDYHLCFGEEG